MIDERDLARPIFVTGLARSGTSMVAGLIAGQGAWTGRTVEPDENNPKGFFEHVGLRERLTKQVLTALNCDPLGVRKLPPFPPTATVDRLREVTAALLEADGYSGGARWLYKDAKLALLWPFFDREFPEADWIIVRRPLQDVVQSCMNTPFMNQHGFSRQEWMQFGREYLLRLEVLRDHSDRVREVWADDLISGNYSPFNAVLRSLSLPPLDPSGDAFVETRYWSSASARASEPPTGTSVPFIKHHASGSPFLVQEPVAVVGNSDTLSGAGFGETIDSHPTVFRFNVARIGGSFQGDTGNRASAYFASKSLTRDTAEQSDEDKDTFRNICAEYPVISFPGQWVDQAGGADDFYYFEMSIPALNALFRQKLGDDLELFSHQNQPRNGIRLIAALIAAGVKPALYGFDLTAREGASHYYDDELQLEAAGVGHRPSLEFQLLDRLASAGLIKVVQAGA